jgi:hypothetical protein
LQPSQVEQSQELQSPHSQVQDWQESPHSEVAETGNTAVATMDQAMSGVFIMKYLSEFKSVIPGCFG